jgi:hypothetical protein
MSDLKTDPRGIQSPYMLNHNGRSAYAEYNRLVMYIYIYGDPAVLCLNSRSSFVRHSNRLHEQWNERALACHMEDNF